MEGEGEACSDGGPRGSLLLRTLIAARAESEAPVRQLYC